MTGRTVVLRAGSVLQHDGERFTVVELAGARVLLKAATGGLRQVEVGWLVSHPTTRLEGAAAEGERGLALGFAMLDSAGDAQVRVKLEHVQEVLTGFRYGAQELALAGEPRAAYRPGVPMMERYASKAAEAGVSTMTVRRWVMTVRGPEGVAGLVGKGERDRSALGRTDPRWLDACRKLLEERVNSSRLPRSMALMMIEERLAEEFGRDTVPLPGRSTAYAVLAELSRGSNAFAGSTKGKRQIADRPQGVYGRFRATRPGEYLLVDTTRLDVFAMEPVTCRWVQCELSVAMDLYSRCVTGLRLTPVSTKASDIAGVLYESVRPPEAGAGQSSPALPFTGVPGSVVIDARKVVDGQGRLVLPSVAAETLVFDHGKIYMSNHVHAVCGRLGISLQPARPYTATDKAPLERWFRSLGEGLLAALPGYKGADVHSRGLDAEGQAFFFLDELEAIVREWIDLVYHRRPHKGLCVPEVPGLEMSPLEMYEHGLQRAGQLQVLGRPDLAYDFLEVRWTTIQHYGVEVGTLRYNGPSLTRYRNRTSPYGGVRAGAWPIHLDPADITRVYFQDPEDLRWHTLVWEHALAMDGPLSREALQYARQLAARTQRFPDTKRALVELLKRWGEGLAEGRTERRMAVRLSQERLQLLPADPAVAAAAQAGPAAAVSQLPSVRRLAALTFGKVPTADTNSPKGLSELEPVQAGDDDEDEECTADLVPGTMTDDEFYSDTWGLS